MFPSSVIETTIFQKNSFGGHSPTKTNILFFKFICLHNRINIQMVALLLQAISGFYAKIQKSVAFLCSEQKLVFNHAERNIHSRSTWKTNRKLVFHSKNNKNSQFQFEWFFKKSDFEQKFSSTSHFLSHFLPWKR